jgi:hypothetical protein
MRASIVLSSVIACMAVSVALAASPAQLDRTALATKLVEALTPDSENRRMEDAIAGAVKDALTMATALSCGATCIAPELDDRTFAASLEVGANTAIKGQKSAFVRLYSEALSAADLQSVLAFYQSADGRNALNSKVAFVATMQNQATTGGTAQPPQYQPTPAEAAFLATSAGQALTALTNRPEVRFAQVDLLQSAVAATEADYCNHARCGASHHQLFKMMGVIFDSERAHSEHAMFGDTADNLFPNPIDAMLAKQACNGDARGVAASVKAGADVNAMGKEGVGPGVVRMNVTPLFWAIDCNSLSGVAALLAAGADPNKADKLGATAVTLAAGNQNPAILKLILKRGGDPNAHNDREIALQIAMGTEHELERVQHLPRAAALANWDALIAAGADPSRNVPGRWTLIWTLVSDYDFDKAEWVMDHGWIGDPVELGRSVEFAEENAVNRTGISPDVMAALERVKDRLKAMGVRFPVGPLAKLPKDSRGYYVQP